MFVLHTSRKTLMSVFSRIKVLSWVLNVSVKEFLKKKCMLQHFTVVEFLKQSHNPAECWGYISRHFDEMAQCWDCAVRPAAASGCSLRCRGERLQEGNSALTRAGYHVVFFLSPVATPSTQTTLPNRSSFSRWSLSSSSLEDEDNSSSWLREEKTICSTGWTTGWKLESACGCS